MTGLDYLKSLTLDALKSAGYWLHRLGFTAKQRRALWLYLAELEDGRHWWEGVRPWRS